MQRNVFIVFFLITSLQTFATHNRAGEITFRYCGGLSYEFTIITYTYSPSPADRPELPINWGDGTSEVIARTEKIDYPNDIRRNKYVRQHTFPAPGEFTVSLEDPNRNGGVINIPNSIEQPFYIYTTLMVNPFIGGNSSPELLNPPIDNACINKTFVHNPGAADPDGDSLSYRLVKCRGEGGLEIPGYTFPSANNLFEINPITGELIWDSPLMQGEFNIAILIEEWRNGTRIGSITRDMQIEVIACNNNPPIIATLKDTCIHVNQQLSFAINATDPDLNTIELTYSPNPFPNTANPALLNLDTAIYGLTIASFLWTPDCNNIKRNLQYIYFKARDNGTPVRLVDYESFGIKVICPPLQNFSVTPSENSLVLSWQKCQCNNASGYIIYRKIDSSDYSPSYCETGVPTYTGFTKYKELNSIYDTMYSDNNLGFGLTNGLKYCYMVTAKFSNGAESQASTIDCGILKRDAPIITHVTIDSTATSNGQLTIKWAKPTDFDTIVAPGPYKYLIYQCTETSTTQLQLIDSLSGGANMGLDDSIYIKRQINTLEKGYIYRVDVYNETPGNRFLIDSSSRATSVLLQIIPSDNSLQLQWNNNQPWQNKYWDIYRKSYNDTMFRLLTRTFTPSYKDVGLLNYYNYCYYVKSTGFYAIQGLNYPLINLSQQVCSYPVDQTPPLAPVLEVVSNCETIENTLNWQIQSDINDVFRFKIYYLSGENATPITLATLEGNDITSFVHENINTIAGCYYVTALDSVNNESEPSNKICIDIDVCDLYRIPNVFTPNNDQINDILIPFPYNFVEKINLNIYNRWGQLVFKTENPDILWDGKNQSTKQDCSEGIYYYTCDVYERRLSGIKVRTIAGIVHLLRYKK